MNDEPIYERDYFEELQSWLIYERDCELSKMADNKILDIAINIGAGLNYINFHTYDIALKLRNNNWKPTIKQREAIIGIIARYEVERGLI